MEVSGKIELGGVTSEFILTEDLGWQQWGVNNEQAGQRVDLLERLAAAYAEWVQENLCPDCGEALIDQENGETCEACADSEPRDGL